MDYKKNDYSTRLLRFVHGSTIKTLKELLNSKGEVDCVVPVWFHSVVEGVDMWYADKYLKDQAKFRMKMKVTYGDCAAVFIVVDKVVEKLAMETSPVLLAMGECCSLYPDEMECFYGDALLCKVQKREEEELEGLPTFKIVDVCNEVEAIDFFFDEFIIDVDKFVEGPGEIVSKELDVLSNVYHSSCDSIEESIQSNQPDMSIDIGSSQISSGAKVSIKDEIDSPSPEDAWFKRKRKYNKGVYSTNVETLVYSKRKVAAKRKLNFSEKCCDAAAKTVVEKTN